jgi:hypothetical protein
MTPPSEPVRLPAEVLPFLASYGWAMWTAQRFEYYLAGLSILRSPVKSPARLLDTEQKAYSALEKQFAIYRHRFERASAKELQQLLPDDLPERLRAEIDELVGARNDLAHRYLRRALEAAATPDWSTEAQAVQRLGQRFLDAGEWLLRLMEEAVREHPSNLSDAQFEAIQSLGRAAASGASLDDALHSSQD